MSFSSRDFCGVGGRARARQERIAANAERRRTIAEAKGDTEAPRPSLLRRVRALFRGRRA